MMETDAIRRYIAYLRAECGLRVSLHPKRYETLISESALLRCCIHEIPYCILLKTNPAAFRHCVAKQEAVMEKCAAGPFCGVCHAGMREFVYPIRSRGTPVGFISVSGYGAPNAESYLHRISEKYDLPLAALRRAYAESTRPAPPSAQIDTLLLPLYYSLAWAYEQQPAAPPAPNFAQRLLQYVRQNHTRDLTRAELCRVFYCSPSFISHQFRAHAGKGLREYVNDLRVSDAKSLLAASDWPITEISLAVGFNDSAYFANVFRARTGQTPSEYRAARRAQP